MALKDLWCPLRCPYGVWWPYSGVWWPYRISGTHSDVFIGFDSHDGVLMGFGGPTGGFGGPTGSLVPIVLSLWGLVALQGGLVTL